MKWIVSKTSRMFLFALLWGAWMLLCGAMPHLLSNTSLESLTFQYRDYLLRMFVVFLAAHLVVRQTNLKLLVSIPLISLALWQGVDVYAFSEWFSRSFRVNLHELNAQLFVVPVQVALLAVGIYFCTRKSLRTTTRIFATVMLGGSILSTLGFHLSIVNVTYKPIERVYADQIYGIAALDKIRDACAVLKSDCRQFSLGGLEFDDDLSLDPQLALAHKEVFPYLMASNSWVRSGIGPERYLGIASLAGEKMRVAEVKLPINSYSGAMQFAFAGGDCPRDYRCWSWAEAVPAEIQSMALASGVLADLSTRPTYLHAWSHTVNLPNGAPAPALYIAGRRGSGEHRLAAAQISNEVMDRLSQSLAAEDDCLVDFCQAYAKNDLADGLAEPARELLESLSAGHHEQIAKLWVDKALSRNPVLYIDRPEFLRYYGFHSGKIRIITSPMGFSDITKDLKITFNLIIGIFSVAWLTLGVFLILFHTRRQLAKP